jgi:hypothetical protein
MIDESIAVLGAVACVIVGGVLIVRDAFKRLADIVPLEPKHQSVDCAGVPFDYESFYRGWDEYCARREQGDAPDVVEDWELDDAIIEDREVEMLEQWFARPSRPGRVR